MIEVIKSEDRGKTKLDWLDSKHTFSFGKYHNPSRMNLGKLIVFNDDIVKPSKGFGAHPHDNAEIISIVLKGRLKHEDSAGNKGIISAGELQRISAGKGVWHSEFNDSDKEEVHFLQIWIEPNQMDVDVSYEQKKIDNLEKNKLNLVVSGSENNKKVTQINQDADIFLGEFEKNNELKYNITRKRNIYLFLIDGNLNIENKEIVSGDSVFIYNQTHFEIKFNLNSKIILIEISS